MDPSGRAGPVAAPPGVRRSVAAVSGVLAAAVALAVTELAAGLAGAVPSLLVTVGDAVIEATPGPVVAFAIATFGSYNRPVLLAGLALVAAGAGALLGLAAARRELLGVVGLALFGLVGVAAARVDPVASAAGAAAAATVGVAAGAVTLHALLTRARRDGTDSRPGTPASARAVPADGAPGPTRRRFLEGAAAAVVIAGAAGGLGRWLVARGGARAARETVTLPPAARPLPPAPAAADLRVDGLSPLYTPNDDFYRIDTALTVPQVDPDGWVLRLTGMVERELELTYADLLDLPQVEADVTLACVSNEVGGDLVGNARWRGVWLPDVLARAGVADDADQVVGRAVDGWTAGFPTAAAGDGRDALIALGMNGEPLPLPHGFPARLVIAGLYGYVSDTKWLSEIELTTFDAFDAYWVPRGWAEEGPIKTQSRIDVPRARARVDAGAVAVAGVAWAGVRGVARVEVRVDDGPWREARLGEELDVGSWRQWVYDWDARPGEHTLAVRATDGDGDTQTSVPSDPRPDGATGHHTITVSVA